MASMDKGVLIKVLPWSRIEGFGSPDWLSAVAGTPDKASFQQCFTSRSRHSLVWVQRLALEMVYPYLFLLPLRCWWSWTCLSQFLLVDCVSAGTFLLGSSTISYVQSPSVLGIWRYGISSPIIDQASCYFQVCVGSLGASMIDSYFFS